MEKLTLEELVCNLSDEDLQSCYFDIKEYFYGSEGVLKKDSIVRKVVNEFNEMWKTNFHIMSAPQYFLFEIAKRKYEIEQKE